VRRYERAFVALTHGVVGAVLVCPAGHKYEVTQLSYTDALAAGDRFLVFLTMVPGPLNSLVDDYTIPAGLYGVSHPFTVLQLNEGDALGVLSLGTGSPYCLASYIDVTV
jgi:hypothetical protein